mmetsp:Transcript_9980/g.14689  ORF Transcript_9980/g.14689 Transcript_9980/m.14689 type:complete len:234 (-) Transcript_9980:83-784(-)
MGKGANYLNNNKGVFLKAGTKKKEAMPMCNYGRGCTNRLCIYRHPTGDGSDGSHHQSKEPCMAFLAGICAFDSKGCHKRHPNKEEAARLRAKYERIKCRFGDNCKTQGCLYQHPSDDPIIAAPLVGTNLAWDNQCHFVPPPQYAGNHFQQAQENFIGQQPLEGNYYQEYIPQVETHEHRPSLPNINATEFVPGKMSFASSSAAQMDTAAPRSSLSAGSSEFIANHERRKDNSM